MLVLKDLSTANPGERDDLDAAALSYAEGVATASASEAAALREQIIQLCLPFAGRLARRYRGRGERLEDLQQVARLGLVEAIDRYEPQRGSFTAYAVITITGEIKRHFRDRTWGVHVPRRIQELSLEVNQAITQLTTTMSRKPTVTELARHLRLPEPAVLEALASSAGYTPVSLNAPVCGGDGARELGDLIGDGDRDLESADDKITLAMLLRHLPDRERRVLALRFYGSRSQQEIAVELGISQMQVSRLLVRVLAWLREAMLSDTPPSRGGRCSLPDDHALRVSVRRRQDALSIRVSGEVDRDSAQRLRIDLRRAVAAAAAAAVVIDVSTVALIDAAGVAVLLDVAAAAALAHTTVMVTGVPHAAHALHRAGLSWTRTTSASNRLATTGQRS
jgi:RNA polymerase sigma-B factor